MTAEVIDARHLFKSKNRNLAVLPKVLHGTVVVLKITLLCGKLIVLHAGDMIWNFLVITGQILMWAAIATVVVIGSK